MKRLITPENNVKLALELRRGRWLVHDISTLIPTAISLLQQQDILLQAAEREFDIILYDVDARAVSANAARSGDPCVAVIPISGTITKYDSCGTIGTATYAQALLAAAADTNVVACVLDIDSGGGNSTAIPCGFEFADRIQHQGHREASARTCRFLRVSSLLDRRTMRRSLLRQRHHIGSRVNRRIYIFHR